MADFPEVFKKRRPDGENRVDRGTLQLEEWNDIIRVLAHYRVSQYKEVEQWEVREGLLSYIDILRRKTLEQYRHDLHLYAAGALKKVPTLPRILRDA